MRGTAFATAAIMVILVAVPALAAPEPPRQLRVRPVNGVMEVNWLKSADDPVFVSGYEVVRAIFASGPYNTVCVTMKGAASCLDRKAEPGKRYFYKIRSIGIGDQGASAYTIEAIGELPTPPPAEPEPGVAPAPAAAPILFSR